MNFSKSTSKYHVNTIMRSQYRLCEGALKATVVFQTLDIEREGSGKLHVGDLFCTVNGHTTIK